MNTFLWIVQGLLAASFLMAGFAKVLQPKDKLLERMAWVEDFSVSHVRLLGAVEILGALGLVVPHLTGILPWLTPLAALGLAIIMLGAVVVHARRKERVHANVNFVLALFCAFVAYGRFFLPLV